MYCRISHILQEASLINERPGLGLCIHGRLPLFPPFRVWAGKGREASAPRLLLGDVKSPFGALGPPPEQTAQYLESNCLTSAWR